MPLLVDNAINATGGGKVSVTAALISRKVHRDLPATTLFGYLRPGSPGRSIRSLHTWAPRSWPRAVCPISVDYINTSLQDDYLRVFTNGGSSYLQFAPFPEVRTMTHLHGGFQRRH